MFFFLLFCFFHFQDLKYFATDVVDGDWVKNNNS